MEALSLWPDTLSTTAVAPADKPALLRVNDLDVGYGTRVVLRRVNLAVPARGLMALMGPSGVGKSTLLRTIGRWNDAQPAFWATGEIWLRQENILRTETVEQVHRHIPMVPQKARLYTGSVLDNALAGRPEPPPPTAIDREHLAYQVFHPWGLWDEFAPLLHKPVMALSMAAHKKILIARLLTREADGLLIDEPLRDVAVAEEGTLMALLRQIAARRMVLMVTHNKNEARHLCHTVCLITGDSVVEVTPAEEFFACPRTELGREFLRSGSCWPRAATDSKELLLSVAAPGPRMSFRPPREFHWVIMGLLGGMQYPGLLGDVDEDLAGLRHLGVRVLVSLTEAPFDAARLQAFHIQGAHYPVVDMSIPTLPQAEAMCRYIAALVDAQQATVLHCKAGLGRTGTMLACVLVYRGMDAMRAIEAVRTVKPGYIQTDGQLEFVATFADYCGTH